jgi:hypothetical protein
MGLGWIGNTIVVLTDENIYLLSGQAEAMSTTKLPGRYPCLSKPGIVSCELGVLFPSDEGIVLVTLDGPSLLSYDYFTKEQYYDNYSPSVIRAAYYNGKYFAFHNNGCFVIDGRDKAMIRLSMAPDVAAPHVSLADNSLYFVLSDEGTNALYKFAGETTDDYMEYLYQSQEFLLPALANFSTARVIRDVSEWGADNAANIIANAAIFAAGGGQGVVNEPEVNSGEVNYDGLVRTYTGITFRIYGDDTLLHTQSIDDDAPFRLPAGVLYRRMYYEIEGDIPVVEVVIATSTQETFE